MESGKLYVVATPIGNLSDITFRAVGTLKDADLIAAEDSRVAQKLLNHYQIAKKVISYHQHSKIQKIDLLVRELKAGRNIALITDAGTPGISDPGNYLVAKAVENGVPVIPVPGPSALGALVSVAGIDLQRFVFLGFPPHKKGRETYLREVAEMPYPAIYYDSPHRVLKNLKTLATFAPEKRIILGRELTKIFEEVVRGTIGEVITYLETHSDKVRGEFACIASDHIPKK